MATATSRAPEEILDGLLEIAGNDMMVRGVYVSRVERPDLREAGTICGGRRSCLVGSLCLAAGVIPFDLVHTEVYRRMVVEADGGSRGSLRDDNPSLDVAWEALDRAAEEWAGEWKRTNDKEVLYGAQGPYTHGWAEALFEARNLRIGTDELTVIVARAKELLPVGGA